MKYMFRAVLVLSIIFVFLGCSPTTSEKDVIGKWQNSKLDTMWMEFYPDMTSTGGKWSITREGHIKIVNADGKEHLGVLQDGKLTFAEFGDLGVFVKDAGKK